jgi:uncharacterized surface protein with fasciclin (FAS1) repeats
MFKKLIIITSIILTPLASTYAGCGACDGKDHKNEYSKGKADIVDTAIAAGQFKTLATALEAAGLVEVLKGDGPFTVFAPTDEAFAALPEGTVEELLKPENKDKLVKILTYHVLPIKVKSKKITSGKVETVNGQSVTVEVSDDGITVDGANVIEADIKASNGIIHVIDKVILPES